jgi:Ca2+-binding RTX toxin-like protein
MSVHSYLRRFRRWAKPAAKPRQVRACLGLETLEDRLVPSTLKVVGSGHNRVLTFQAAQNEANDLRISFATTTTGTTTTTTYTFEDKGAAIVDANGNLHSSLSADDSTFDRIQVNLMDPNAPDTVGNTLRILSTGKAVSVVGGNGSDTITLGAAGHGMDDLLDMTRGSITIDGGTQTANGKDKLILDDRDGTAGSTSTGPSHYNFNVTGTSVNRDLENNFGQPLGLETSVSLADMENLEIRAGNDDDSFFVASTLATTPVEIKAGDGDNTIRTGNMDLLAGLVTVHGEGGTNSLVINDTSATGPRNYVLNTDSVKQGATTIALDTLSSLEIDAPNQVNTFDVQTSTSLMPLTLNGGTDSDTVTMSDSARSSLDTYDFFAGKLERLTFVLLTLPTAYVNYSKIDNLVVKDGSGSDSFMMTDTAQPVLTIDGGKGFDTIDYSTFAATSPVTVNLTRGDATKVSSLSNVENANGGAGSDLLVGNDNANVLDGNGGNDVIIGGKGTDTLLGGAGEDLIFAGYTDYDNDPTKLQTILNTWSGSGGTQTRSNKLRNGVGGVKLDDSTSGTVHDDGAHDVVTAGSSLDPTVVDWIWANKGTKANQDSLTDYLSSTDILN